MDLLSSLLPLGTSFRVEDLAVDAPAQQVTVELQAIATSRPCPSRQMPAERIHSHYQRTVADLPWAELVVRLRLYVRTFFCDNAACRCKVFSGLRRTANVLACRS
jgi:transposase